MTRQIRLFDFYNRFVKIQEKGSLRIHNEVEVTNISTIEGENVGIVQGINEHGKKVEFRTDEIQFVEFLDTLEQAQLRSCEAVADEYTEILSYMDESNPAYSIFKDTIDKHEELKAKGVELYKSVRA